MCRILKEAGDIDVSVDQSLGDCDRVIGVNEDISEPFRDLMFDKIRDKQGAQSEPEGLWPLIIAAKPQELIVGFQDFPGLMQSELSQLRGRRSIRGLHKQCATDEAFKPFDLRTYGGLTETQPFARFRKASGLRNSDKGPHDLDRDIQVLVPSAH